MWLSHSSLTVISRLLNQKFSRLEIWSELPNTIACFKNKPNSFSNTTKFQAKFYILFEFFKLYRQVLIKNKNVLPYENNFKINFASASQVACSCHCHKALHQFYQIHRYHLCRLDPFRLLWMSSETSLLLVLEIGFSVFGEGCLYCLS